MAGLFAMWETVQFETSIPIALFDPEAAFTDSNNVDHETTLYSPFLRLDYQVSEQWKLIAGLRYSNEEKEGDVRYQFSVGLDSLDIDNADAFRWDSLAGLRVPGTFIEGEFDESWDLWGGKLGVEFAPYDQALYYAHVSQGEKAGQYTDAPDAIANGGFFTPADPETVVAYEAGAKLGWLDRRLLTNVAVYFNDYEGQHQQITYPDPDTPGNLISTVVNVADSETWGVELDMQYAPGNGWMLSASAAYLDTETKADSLGELTGGVVAVPVGRELTNAPQWILTGALRKAWTYSDGSGFVLDFDIRYTDERNFDLVEAAAAPVWVTDESYVLANASAVYRFGADGDYFLSVWGKNLTDELYFGMMQEFGIGTNIAFTGEPRTYGVSAGFSF
jgi:iron complex outermembrane receptor protein